MLLLELQGCQVVQTAVRAHGIEVQTPCFDDDLGFCARARERNHSTLRHSSRSLPLKLSSLAFCQGLPGSIRAVPMPAWASH